MGCGLLDAKSSRPLGDVAFIKEGPDSGGVSNPSNAKLKRIQEHTDL